MCDVPVFYATTEGQTRVIAEWLARQMTSHGLDSRAIEVGSPDADQIDWTHVRGVGVGASLHLQKHQRQAVEFVRAHRQELAVVPSLFFSVSLSAASKRPAEVAAARRIAEGFATETGWQPRRIECVAGRLAYTKYNWFTRFFLRRIALKEGASGDTSRDHEYTDWNQVTSLAHDLVTEIRRSEQEQIRRSA